MRAHTLVIGGGVMGLSIAAELAARLDPLEAPVVLLERREFGAGSSGRSGAILRAFYSDRELIGMARDSLRAYASFATRTGRTIGFTRCGVLSIGAPGAQAALIERNVAAMRECGIEVERIDAARLRELVPGIDVAPDTIAAFEPGGGFVDPQRTCQAFAALARSRGATLREGARVVRWFVEHGRAVAVEVESAGSLQRVEFQRAVVAAGPWTRALLELLGVRLPLRAVRPEQHFVGPPAPSGGAAPFERESPEEWLDARFAPPREPRAAHPVLLDLEHGFYTRCEPARGRTRVGALDYARDRELADPDALDERVSADFSAWARERLCSRLPAYRETPDVDAQAAWYTLTPDSQALIGPCPGAHNVFVASGFSGHGFKLAPSIGEGVAQLVLGEAVGAFDTNFFAPERFELRRARSGGAFGL